MGDKYILELEDKPLCVFDEDTQTYFPRLHRVKGFNSLVFDQNGLNNLTPYTEPDMETIRKEAYQKGYEDATVKISSDEQAIAEKAYQRGLNDAWEAARKIAHCFLWGKYQEETGRSSVCAQDVLEHYSAQEAIEEIRAHEQAQKEKEKQEEKDSVTAEDVMRQYLDTFCKGRSCTGCPLNTSEFTCGRGYHFLTTSPVSDEEARRAYATVIAKMKE